MKQILDLLLNVGIPVGIFMCFCVKYGFLGTALTFSILAVIGLLGTIINKLEVLDSSLDKFHSNMSNLLENKKTEVEVNEDE